jgi:hypothetical protein
MSTGFQMTVIASEAKQSPSGWQSASMREIAASLRSSGWQPNSDAGAYLAATGVTLGDRYTSRR